MRARDLVVFSHLRWVYVWQRPQHIVSRMAGRRTWFIEEPVGTGVERPMLGWEQRGPITRVWLEVPGDAEQVAFDDPAALSYLEQLRQILPGRGHPLVWLYTPSALQLAQALRPAVLVYDVMDDLASFRDAPPSLPLRQQQALAAADLVFAGGRSLFHKVTKTRTERAYLFASGVEPEHYAAARGHRCKRERPVAGYVGVVDERLDLDLIAGLAAELPNWDIQIVGPVAKIDPNALPRAANITYTGHRPYDELPSVMAGFDVALMPFALNEATRSISPTKTLEYVAAGLPVVSTRVPDVVTDYGAIVDLQDSARGFAAACRRVNEHCVRDRDVKLDALLKIHHWDAIARRMEALIAEAAKGKVLASETEESAISVERA